MSDVQAVALLKPSIFDRAVDAIGSRVTGWRFNRAKFKLERELARIVDTANGHRTKKLPPGSPAYVELYQQATKKIDEFCAHHEVPRLTIEREVPVLRDLEQLTHPPSAAAGAARAIGILVAVIVGAILLGGASGLVSTGYHWVVSLLVP